MENVISWTTGLSPITKVQIFSHLSLRDRENVRFVCKDWYAVSWSRKLILNDWVHLDDDQFSDVRTKMSLMCDIFSSPKAGAAGKPCSFEIGRVRHFHRGCRRFWRVFGPSVTRLRFDAGPRVDANLMQLILESCTSLQRLDMLYSSDYLPPSISETSLATIGNNLRSLRECRMFLRKHGDIGNLLIGIPLNSLSCEFELDILPALLAAHRIKQVSLSVRVVDKPNTDTGRAKVFEEISQNPRLRLTSLHLTLAGNTFGQLAPCVFKNLPVHSDTLTKLDLTVFENVENDSALGKVLQGLNSLSRLEECTLRVPQAIVTKVVHSVLNSNPGLKALKVDRQCFGIAQNIWNWPVTTFLDDLQTSLTSVSVHSFTVRGFLVINNGRLAAFMGPLTSLRLSNVSDLTNVAMQLICKECTCLRELKIENCEQLTDVGLTGRPNLLTTSARSKTVGLSNLKKLEELLLCGNFGSATIAELVFPSLRALRWQIEPLSDEDLLLIAGNNPRLETFHTWQRYGADSPLTWPGVERFLARCPRLVSLGIGDANADATSYYDHDDEHALESPQFFFTVRQMRTVHRRFPTLKRLNENLLVGV